MQMNMTSDMIVSAKMLAQRPATATYDTKIAIMTMLIQ